jgi:hypothetical protein
MALRAKFSHDPVDVRPGADIHAARWLIHDENPRLAAINAATEGEFLLIAAAEFIRKCIEPTPIDAYLCGEIARYGGEAAAR